MPKPNRPFQQKALSELRRKLKAAPAPEANPHVFRAAGTTNAVPADSLIPAETYVEGMRSAMHATGFFTVDAQLANRAELVRARVLSFSRMCAWAALDYDAAGRRLILDNLYAFVLVGTNLRPECDADEVQRVFSDHLYALGGRILI